MTSLILPQLDPKNPEDMPTIIRSLATSVKNLDEKLDKNHRELSAQIRKIEKRSNKWLPKSLWGWLILAGFVFSILYGCYEIVTVKDHEQDIKLQVILSKLDDKR